MPDDRKTFDIKQATIPIVSVAAVVGALLAGVFWIQSSIGQESARLSTDIRAVSADVQSVKEKVTAIDSSRFTAADGLELWKQISVQRENLARIEQRQADLIERVRTVEKK